MSKIVEAAGRLFPGSEAVQAASDSRANKLLLERLDKASALLDQAQRMLEGAGRTYNRPGQPLTERTVARTLASALAIGEIVDKAALLMRKL